MTKRSSESFLGEALRGIDIEDIYVYRLPDPKTGAGVSNWKPCDWMVWWPSSNGGTLDPDFFFAESAWVEAKDTDQVNTFPYADLRPSQLDGILRAGRLGIPYLLAVYWRRAKRWTISDAPRVLAWFNEAGPDARPKSIPRELLMSRFGHDASPANVGQTIKIILEEGF